MLGLNALESSFKVGTTVFCLVASWRGSILDLVDDILKTTILAIYSGSTTWCLYDLGEVICTPGGLLP